MHQLNSEIQALIAKTCKGKEHVKLTVGTYADGEKNIQTFDATGEIPNKNYIYEIGSITKTFTASLLAKCAHEGKLSLDDSIKKYLDGLDSGAYYPTLKRLATHTAGYATHLPMGRFELIRIPLGLHRKWNRGIRPFSLDLEKMKMIVRRNKFKDKDYPMKYSNFGYGLLGYAVGVATGKGYWGAMDEFLSADLGLKNSYTGPCAGKNLRGFNGRRDVGNWLWDKDLTSPAGDISSTAEDVLEYAKINMNGEKPYLALCHQKHADVNVKRKEFAGMGLGWLLQEDNNIIWHNGGTAGFISHLAIDRAQKCALVVLINHLVHPLEITKLGFAVFESLRKG